MKTFYHLFIETKQLLCCTDLIMRLTSFGKSRLWGCYNLDMYILDLG